MNPSAGYRWLNLALSLTALFATLLHAVASDRRVMCAALYHELTGLRPVRTSTDRSTSFQMRQSGSLPSNSLR
jgi:hypothetical protein